MRYRLLASYQGAPYEAGVGPQENGVVLFAACPPPEDLGFEPATGHWRKQVERDDVQSLYEARPVGMFRGERCVVLDELNDRLHIAYLGHDAFLADQLGFWEVDRGVFELITPRQEVTEITEQRLPVAGPGEATSFPQPAPPPTAHYGDDPGQSNGSRHYLPPQDLLAGPELATPRLVRAPDEHPLPLEAEAMRAARKAKETETSREPDHAPQQIPEQVPEQVPEQRSAPTVPVVPPISMPAGISEPSGGPHASHSATSVPSWSPQPQPHPQPQVPPQPQVASQREAGDSARITESATGWPSVSSPATTRAQQASPPERPASASDQPVVAAGQVAAPAGPASAAASSAPAAGQEAGVSLLRPGPPVSAGSGNSVTPGGDADSHLTEPDATGAAARGRQEPAPFAGAPPADPPVRVNGAYYGGTAGHDGQDGTPSDRAGSGVGMAGSDPAAGFPYGPAMASGPATPTATAGRAATTASSAAPALGSPYLPTAPYAPAETDGAQPASRRRRASRRRLPTQRIFSELAAQAGILPGAYAINEDVDGAMCLVSTGEGFEVFNSLAGARHEVRVFGDEESAYFYLFGVLAAEAVRTGLLGPAR